MANYYYDISTIEKKYGYNSGIAQEARRIDSDENNPKRDIFGSTANDYKLTYYEAEEFEAIARVYIRDTQFGFFDKLGFGADSALNMRVNDKLEDLQTKQSFAQKFLNFFK